MLIAKIGQRDGEVSGTPPGFRHFSGLISAAGQRALLSEIQAVIAAAPLFTPRMPRSGRPFSVRMTNCGSLGWVSDKEGGYRYQADHPETGRPWPQMPSALLDLWSAVSNYEAAPEACLVNYYGPVAKMGLHRDEDEEELGAPVVSVSLGETALFRIGGKTRRDKTRSLELESGDVVVLAGEARLAYHGVDRIRAGTSALLGDVFPQGGRLNLTLRRVTPP